MQLIIRRARWRLIAAPLIALAVMIGYVAYTPSHPRRADAPTKLTARDLLLAATAAKTIHMQFDGVTGAAGATHTNHALIKSFAWSISSDVQISAGAVGGGTAHVGDITITKVYDKYSVGLVKDELTNAHAHHAILYFTNVNAAGVPFDNLEIDLTDAFVKNFSTKSSGDNPVETIALLVTGFTIKAKISGNQTVTFNVLTGATT